MEFNDRPGKRAELGTRARFLLKSDLSQCYGSLYTHSLEWALTSKESAKEQRRLGLRSPGADLDSAIRLGQLGQTKGIPIGPDTSLAVAELILSAMDHRFDQNLRSSSASGSLLPGFRLIDDFEYYASSRSEAEDALLAWELAASHFELQINIDKTEILALPHEVETDWVITLSQFQFDSRNATASLDSLIRFFSLVFRLSGEHPHGAVITKAIFQVFKDCSLSSPQVRKTFVEFLMASLLVDPSSCKFVYIALERLRSIGAVIDTDVLSGTLNEVVVFHSRLEHGYVVSWALFMIHQFGLELSSEGASAVIEMSDNLSLLVLDAIDDAALIVPPMPSFATVLARAEEPGAPYGPDWLLAYEFAAQGKTSGTHVRSEPLMKLLLASGVRFLDGATFPAGLLSAQGVGGDEIEYEPDRFFEVRSRDLLGTWTYLR